MGFPQNLSVKDIALFAAVMKNMNGGSAGWEDIAKASNHKTAKYARDRFAVVQKKIIGGDGAGNDNVGTLSQATASKLSDKDVSLLNAYVEEVSMSVNCEIIAKESDHKTPKYARDRWAVVKNKLVGEEKTGDPQTVPKGCDTSTKSCIATSRSRKRKAEPGMVKSGKGKRSKFVIDDAETKADRRIVSLATSVDDIVAKAEPRDEFEFELA